MPLARQSDVDQGSYGLHANIVLGVVKKVAHAAQIGRMPLEDVELLVVIAGHRRQRFIVIEGSINEAAVVRRGTAATIGRH